MIKNIKSKGLDDEYTIEMRTQFVNRARWFMKTLEAGLDNGLGWEFGHDAMLEAGRWTGYNQYPRNAGMKLFAKTHMSKMFEAAHEAEIVKLTDEEYEVEMHYCPLVEAFMEYTQDEEYIAKLCECACMSEKGLAETFHFNFECKKPLAKATKNVCCALPNNPLLTQNPPVQQGDFFVDKKGRCSFTAPPKMRINSRK